METVELKAGEYLAYKTVGRGTVKVSVVTGDKDWPKWIRFVGQVTMAEARKTAKGLGVSLVEA